MKIIGWPTLLFLGLWLSPVHETDASLGKEVYSLYHAGAVELQNTKFSIPVTYNDAVAKYIRYFTRGKGRSVFVRFSKRGGKYAPLMSLILETNGMPKDLIFLAMAESGFNSSAESWASAVGPWQFMSFTGRRFGLKIDWYQDQRKDPIKATIAAVKYLKILHGMFGDWSLAFAGYNAGEGKMKRAIRKYGTRDFWKIRKGRYLRRETKDYVPKIIALAIIGKNLKAFGFNDINFHEPLDFEEVEVPGGTDLFKLAEKMKIPFEKIRDLNPELLRWKTPFNQPLYSLRLPVGSHALYTDCCFGGDFKATDFQKYKLKNSGTLAGVARRFKIKDASVLDHINKYSLSKRLRRGTVVNIPFRTGQSITDKMYKDLYRVSRRRGKKSKYRRSIAAARRKGKLISNPTVFYKVQKGETLWDIAKKTGVSLNTLIRSNLSILNNRMIRSGDRLAIR